MMQDFDTIYGLYQTPIFRYCFRKCGQEEVSKDLAQETFLRFLLCLKREEKILDPRAFLYCIARNLFIDHVRRKKADSLDQLWEETRFEPGIDPWYQTYSRLDAERPLKKLSKMPSEYKQALHYRFIVGLLPAEIATMTGDSANTISVRIFRGLKQLQAILHTPTTV